MHLDCVFSIISDNVCIMLEVRADGLEEWYRAQPGWARKKLGAFYMRRMYGTCSITVKLTAFSWMPRHAPNRR